MPPLDEPPQSPHESDSEPAISVQKRRFGKLPLSSISQLPYRRSNASLSNLFSSTTALPTGPGSPGASGTTTPTAVTRNGSVFSPGGTAAVRSPSPAPSGSLANNHTRDVILRAFSPHVSVLASQDTDELVRHKGINGGLLDLLRPFGERVSGKVTIRDSTGVSRSYEDFAVRFTGVKDGLESPRVADRRSIDSTGNRQRPSLLEFKPARLRTGGDVPQVEELVERHLTFAEEHSGPVADYISAKDGDLADPNAISPFYNLYMRRLLSGLPMVPSETFAHPVAAVIAISSRSASPIEELRNLYDSSNTGEHRLPLWVHNEYLRYYVLIHDEDYDDITKSMALYDQMKRHFGLHCHLLRLRSTQCVPSDDDSVKLQHCEWTAAAEELSEIVRRETNDDEEDPTPYIFESDATAVRAFVREMVTQSIIPSMERASATWNDQVASRRRGLSGRFMSLSKRFTTGFGARTSSVPSLGAPGSNYDSLQGFYRPDAPEAVMRKLADYAIMLRDFKLAHGTFEILCQDFKNDKAWRHYADANEMAAVTLLLATGANNKIRIEGIDQYLETAYYSYVTRVGAPYNALRTLLLGVELLRMRGGNALEAAAQWSSRIIDDKLVGPVGHVLLMERIGSCFDERRKIGGLEGEDRHRKAAFWNMLAADAWLRLEKASQAEKCLSEATRLYGFNEHDNKVQFYGMANFLLTLQEAVSANRGGVHHIDGDDLLGDEIVEPMQEESEQLAKLPPGFGHAHRKSLSTSAPPPVQSFDPLGALPTAYESGDAVPASPHAADAPGFSSVLERKDRRDDGFE
ncbi:Transport protein particle subunit trs85-2 [Fulvia fulva]|uniref:Transport protein particle subunit trs85-2 n=1 Tax=Passalora fulva TaxID=5499 RepID=A0A9Q8USG6_PASFU|nr:Transport protein particle subunit trs85-2 [Fulvia fulva]KAK4617470.1 Transport protein particle subunit trs85-2 [Fulvia fulva]KAK4618366.1 Transport protein particle subunit trs85-2 [Fulvia fulva]UJO20755.1 Transport protein particle subunit trs85-2 [Fulvia fulva]WPV18287.1 Transport protein particle subunit trs85-2 [Fulvia fulva]WPV33435.1 Transport protein particle subunit trs85-2 [Fulvia fulva]